MVTTVSCRSHNSHKGLLGGREVSTVYFAGRNGAALCWASKTNTEVQDVVARTATSPTPLLGVLLPPLVLPSPCPQKLLCQPKVVLTAVGGMVATPQCWCCAWGAQALRWEWGPALWHVWDTRASGKSLLLASSLGLIIIQQTNKIYRYVLKIHLSVFCQILLKVGSPSPNYLTVFKLWRLFKALFININCSSVGQYKEPNINIWHCILPLCTHSAYLGCKQYLSL